MPLIANLLQGDELQGQIEIDQFDAVLNTTGAGVGDLQEVDNTIVDFVANFMSPKREN